MRAARFAVAVLVGVLAAAAGVGWLYVTRDVRVLSAGPRLSEALPLEHLARRDAQPLLRLVPVWLAVGGGAGVALALLGRRRVVLWAGLSVLVVLALTGAASDAVQESQHIAPHLAPQLGRGVIWCSAALAAVGAAVANRAVPPRPPRPAAPTP